MWFPPAEAAVESGEEELAAPDATMLMGDDVLQESSEYECWNSLLTLTGFVKEGQLPTK